MLTEKAKGFGEGSNFVPGFRPIRQQDTDNALAAGAYQLERHHTLSFFDVNHFGSLCSAQHHFLSMETELLFKSHSLKEAHS